MNKNNPLGRNRRIYWSPFLFSHKIQRIPICIRYAYITHTAISTVLHYSVTNYKCLFVAGILYMIVSRFEKSQKTSNSVYYISHNTIIYNLCIYSIYKSSNNDSL